MHADLDSFRERKRGGAPPLAALTAWDYPSARILDEAGIDLILVGDSLGMVVLGYEDTTSVSLAEMAHHVRACRRGVRRAPLVGDLPYRSYDGPDQALASAAVLRDAGADAVKLEGGEDRIEEVTALREAGHPVVGHIGMLPQRVREEGGYRKKGKTGEAAGQLLRDARALDALGVSAIVVESVVPEVAAEISRAVEAPTIGIGSGADCDGQILVYHDLLGAFPWFRPPFAIPRAQVADEMRRVAGDYARDVRAGRA